MARSAFGTRAYMDVLAACPGFRYCIAPAASKEQLVPFHSRRCQPEYDFRTRRKYVHVGSCSAIHGLQRSVNRTLATIG